MPTYRPTIDWIGLGLTPLLVHIRGAGACIKANMFPELQ